MTMPSNKWEEVVEQALDELAQGWRGWTHDQLDGTSFIKEELDKIERAKSEAKLALTNAVRELVKETMPEPTSAFDGSEAQVFIIATDQYQANLLKAIGDKE